VGKFFSGFLVATLAWMAVGAGLHLGAGWGPPADPEVVDEVPASTEEPASERAAPRRRSSSGGGGAVPRGNATTGDDLRENDIRMIDGTATGGEEQLSGRQLDAAWDGAMGRVRRCFLLAAGEDEITGRLVFGMRIAGSGQVTAVNLSGPARMTSGECGDCLRDAARQIRFPTFNGPEMLVRYPIELD
jgi:hypothetical protein